MRALAAAALCASACPARADDAVFLCVNPASGAAWRIRVDRAHQTVDSFPATITASRIVWHDVVQGGTYELDLPTGALTVRQASSTGGYFLHDRCRAAQ